MGTGKLAKNYFYNLIGQILILITPLITTPYISRVLGPGNIGIYSYTLSISIYFIIVGNLGYPLYGQREIAYVSDDQRKINEIFYEIFYGQLITLGIAFICYVIFTVGFTSTNTVIYLAQGIGVFASLINIAWLYQGLEKFRIIVIRNLFIKSFFIISLFIFVKSSSDLLTYTLIINLANLFGNAIIFWGIRKYITESPFQIHIKLKKVLAHFKPALILGIPFYITSVYSVLDKTMIGQLTGSFAEVGFFEQSQKVILLAITVVVSLGTVIMPRLSSEISKHHLVESQDLLNRCLVIVLMLSMPIMIGIIVVADNLVPWFFGPGYESVSILLLIFAPLAVVMGLSNILGNQYLVAAKMEKTLGWVMFIGLLVNFIFNLILIPPFKAAGASISTMTAEIVKLFFMFWILKDIVSWREFLENFLKYFACSCLMGLIVEFIKIYFTLESGVLETLLLTGIGIIAYIIILICIRDYLLRLFTSKFLLKLKR